MDEHADPRRVVSVVIVEDHLIMREAVRRFLEAESDISVIGEFASVEEAVATPAPPIDVLVVDIGLGGLNGLDGLPVLLTWAPGARVLVLTGHDDPSLARRALDNGALGFVTKGSAPADLVRAVRDVARGITHLAPGIAARITERSTGPRLSDRERDVLAQLVDGRRITDIADELGVSVKTASTLKTRIMRKTGRSTVADLKVLSATDPFLLPPSDRRP